MGSKAYQADPDFLQMELDFPLRKSVVSSEEILFSSEEKFFSSEEK
jgi:hypothetical protein